MTYYFTIFSDGKTGIIIIFVVITLFLFTRYANRYLPVTRSFSQLFNFILLFICISHYFGGPTFYY